MPDLTRRVPSESSDSSDPEFFTVRVHNYKDDPAHDLTSLHGVFTDRAEAERIANAVSVGWDFLMAEVVPLQMASIDQIALAQRISHIRPDLPADFTEEGAAPDTGTVTDEAIGEAQTDAPDEPRDAVADAIALAEVVHEADWMMAGPRWTWRDATVRQREDALLIASAAVADPTADSDALEALVERLWSSKPRHGAPRRIEAKASKIREWLTRQGLREGGFDRS